MFEVIKLTSTYCNSGLARFMSALGARYIAITS